MSYFTPWPHWTPSRQVYQLFVPVNAPPWTYALPHILVFLGILSRPGNSFTGFVWVSLCGCIWLEGQLGWKVLHPRVCQLVLAVGRGAPVLPCVTSHPPVGSAAFLTWESLDSVPKGQGQKLQSLLSPGSRTCIILPPCSVGQGQSQGEPRFKVWGNSALKEGVVDTVVMCFDLFQQVHV